MGRLIEINEAVLLALQLFDGDETRGVRARVYNNAGTEQAGSPFNLTHNARGVYRNSIGWTPTVHGEYIVNYEVFTDGTYVTLDKKYEITAEVVIVKSTIRNLRDGTAQSATPTTITLDAGASSIDDFYLNGTLQITSGLGVDQARTIIGYVGSTKVATINRAWGTNPNNTSKFTIIAEDIPPVIIKDGTITTSTFATGAVDSNALATSAVTEIVNAIFANSVDGKQFTEICEILLAMAQGKIVKSGSSYIYKKQDNTTTIFTLTATLSDRTRS